MYKTHSYTQIGIVNVFVLTLLLKAVSFSCSLTTRLLLSSVDERLGVNFPELAFVSQVIL